jgi:hypothetical protein
MAPDFTVSVKQAEMKREREGEKEMDGQVGVLSRLGQQDAAKISWKTLSNCGSFF